MISLGSPHVLRAHMRRTCGGSNEIELTAIGVELNGSRHAPAVAKAVVDGDAHPPALHEIPATTKHER